VDQHVRLDEPVDGLEMTSVSPVFMASSKRRNAALLLASWAVDIWFLLGAM
jgi:hypothetical protein